MIEYVAGFLFRNFAKQEGYLEDPFFNYTEVALIRKLRPEWQNGLLNGIGGKIEPGEYPLGAMMREFREEAGLFVLDWQLFATMNCGGNREGKIHFFTHTKNDAVIQSMEKEPVGWYNINQRALDREGVVPNLKFLIPMAYNFNGTTFEIKESS